MSSDRKLAARAAAHQSWANTADPVARTAPARQVFLDRFERQVDPDGTMAPAERARRAAHAKKAYFLGLAVKSARARRLRTQAAALEAEIAAESDQDAAA